MKQLEIVSKALSLFILAKSSGVLRQRVYLMHLSDGNIDEKKARSEVEKVTRAEIIICEE